MRFLSTEAMRELDRVTMEGGVPGTVLMGRAARGLARELILLQASAPSIPPSCLICAGTGNNGGDGFGLAEILHRHGWQVLVWVAGRREAVSGDADEFLQRALQAGVDVQFKDDPATWPRESFDLPTVGWAVDALLGTGSKGAPRGCIRAAVASLRALASEAQVVAIDLPTGLDGDRGQAFDPSIVVPATHTLCLGAAKTACLVPDSGAWMGTVSLVDLGFDFDLCESSCAKDPQAIDPKTVRDSLPQRAFEAHKGSCGHVLVIGGSPGMTGAVSMAAVAALRSGAGLVSVLTPKSCAQAVDSMAPEIMVIPGDEAADGTLAADAWETAVHRTPHAFSSVLLGPGLRQTVSTEALTQRVLSNCRVPLVLDADGLNILAQQAQWPEDWVTEMVLTPHPGEMGRLCGLSATQVQRDRFAALENFAGRNKVTMVLKGARTLVRSQTGETWVNLNGNPGMATAGCGDVLAGFLAGLLAQGMPAFDAARAGVYLHGRAGDLAALRRGQTGLLAGDLLASLSPSLVG